MSLRFHEISEGYHRILNPFLDDQLMLLGGICQISPGIQMLDLACGKGEMLCRWSQAFGIQGTGIDISKVFLTAAHERAAELGVADQITFIEQDAGTYPQPEHNFDIVSCIGATWIGNGLAGTLKLMDQALKPDGLMLVGEPFWHDRPPDAAYNMMGIKKDEFTSLEGTLDRIESAGFELVEMVIASHEGWDRYEGPQWMAVNDYLRNNPSDPIADELHAWITKNRRAYLAYGRKYLGWGVFVLRKK